MKITSFVIILMLWLTALSPRGYSQSKHNSAKQEKQDFVYVLSGQDVRIYGVRKNGTLRVIFHDYLGIGQFPRCLAASPNGQALYVASDARPNDYHSGLIYEFTIRKNGSLSRLGAIEAGSIPIPLAMDGSGSFLYCSSMEAEKHQGLVYQYRTKADGSLLPLKPPLVNLGANFAQSLAVHPSRRYLYALANGKPICFRISRNGTLLRLQSPPIRAEANEIAIDPSGKYAYLLQKGTVISVANIDLRTGSFSNLRPVAHVSRGAYDMSISPQRRVLQITNSTKTAGGAVSEFHIAPDGTLKPSIPPTFSAFEAYTRLAPDPRGQFANVTRSR